MDRYRLHQLKIKIDREKPFSMEEKKALLEDAIISKLKIKGLRVRDIKIIKESVDARDKNEIMLIYSADFSLEKGGVPYKLKPSKKQLWEEAEEVTYEIPQNGNEVLQRRPVIVGFGPCGIFAGLILAYGGYRPIILERGQDMSQRVKAVDLFWKNGILDEESNVQFGEGGAGTFSDGKLNTGIKDKRIRKVLEEFVSWGADEDILYKQKPHIGTDVLRRVVVNGRKRIEALGGEIRFSQRVERVISKEGRLEALKVRDLKRDETYELPCNVGVLAIGHSSRDTFKNLYEDGIKMEQKPFSIGVRVEHQQSLIDRSQYGSEEIADVLGAAPYKLSARTSDGRGVYTFCMCPGGEVVMAASEPFRAVTNGMSNRGRDSGFANSGLLVDVRTSDFGSDDVLSGVEFQRKYEGLAYVNGGKSYRGPICTYGDWIRNNEKGIKVKSSLPDFAVRGITEGMEAFGKKIKDFDREDTKLIAVETRSSSPVRILRDSESLESVNLCGMYPAGEGCGYAGGITSAACDGIRIAEKIIEKYRPI